MDTAIAAALAIRAADALIALEAAEPGAATPISGGINRKHGRLPDPEALQRPPDRRGFAAVGHPGPSTASRRRDPPRPLLPAGPSPPLSPRRRRPGGAPHRGSGRMRTPRDQAQYSFRVSLYQDANLV